MSSRLRPLFVVGVCVCVAAVLLPGAVQVWVDDQGHTWLGDGDPPEAAPGARLLAPEQVRELWDGDLLGEPIEPADRQSSAEDDRYLADVLGARDDVRRGEMKLGLERLRRLRRSHPGRPEAAYLLALVERHRGRLEPARDALRDVLSSLRELPPKWRETAHSLAEELDAEIALLRADGDATWEQRSEASAFFRIAYDHQFAGRAYGQRVLGALERARERMHTVLGRDLGRPLDVRLYTKAHYLEAYQHRFGFATVGFYDGTIHVVSARRPRRELYALLVHEYSHALFQDALGSHRPFFLNEGIADREEERARGRERLSRGEWRRLLDALREDDWIPLHTLVRGFGGLRGKRALLAYLESRAVVEMIDARHPGAIARWLDRCARGVEWETALVAEIGQDTARLEAELQEEVRSRFPPDPLGPAQVSGAQ